MFITTVSRYLLDNFGIGDTTISEFLYEKCHEAKDDISLFEIVNPIDGGFTFEFAKYIFNVY